MINDSMPIGIVNYRDDNGFSLYKADVTPHAPG
jgi:hypothetical protein